MRAGAILGFLLAGLGAGFGLGWISRGAEEHAEPTTPLEREGSLGAPQATALADDRARESTARTASAPPSEARGSSTPAGAPARAGAPMLEGQGPPASWREPGWARASLVHEFRKMSKGELPPTEELDWLESKIEEQIRNMPYGLAHRGWIREQQRRVAGTLTTPRMRFQARVEQGVELTPVPDVRALGPFQRFLAYTKSEPLRVDSPPAAGEVAAHVEGGIVAPGRVFLVDELEIRVFWAPTSRRGNGHVAVRIEGSDVLRLPNVGNGLTARYRGAAVVRPGEEDRVQVHVEGASAEVVLTGRLLPQTESPRPTPFTLAEFHGDGYLTGDPILIQVAADHGGGNPRTVYFDGTDNGRFDRVAEEDLWRANTALKDLKDSSKRLVGAGAIPPGKAYEVTRIEWQARCLKSESHSRVSIQVGREEIIPKRDRNPERAPKDVPDEETLQGSWTGTLRIEPGDRGREALAVTAHYYGVIEARIEGRLVDAPAR